MNRKTVKGKALPKGWRKVKLSEVGEISGGGTPQTSVSEYWGGDIPWLIPSEVTILKTKYVNDTGRKITKKGLSETTLLPENCLIVCTRATIGDSCINTVPMAINQGFKSIAPLHDNIEYLYYMFQMQKNNLLRLACGSTFGEVSKSDFSNIQISLPSLPEQKSIVSLLETWDTAIEKTEALIAAKEKRFKWLLKRLISDQQDNPEWKRVELGEVGSTFSGLSGKSKKDFGKGKPFITYLNIYQNSSVSLSQLGLCSVTTNEKQNRVIKGDALFTASSETPDEVGISSVLLQDIRECYLNSFCFGWRRNLYGGEILSGSYLEYFFRGIVFRKQIRKLAQGATRYNLSKRYLMKTWIIYPNIQEQKAIAAHLNAVQQEIIMLQQLAEQYRAQKRGLMQKLLAGKWRINK